MGRYGISIIPHILGGKEMEQDGGDENENGLPDVRKHTKGDSIRLDKWLN